MKRLLQPFYTILVLSTFVVCLLVALPVFLIAGSFDKAAARRVIWYVVHYWAKGWLFFIGMPMQCLGKRPDKQRYIYIANHISYLDTVLIYAAVPTYFRTLAKKEMSRIPVFGFVYRQVAILVDRSSSESRAKSLRLMWRMLKHECNIAIFPEGTFNETTAPLKDFYDGAFRLAINTQMPILPMVFPDTVHRWHYSAWWKLWPGRNRVMYLAPVYVTGMTMEDLPALKEKVHAAMAAALLKCRSSYPL